MENKQLEAIRFEIDALDRELVRLLENRMELVSRVAGVKKENKLEILDSGREQRVLENVLSAVENPDYSDTIKADFESIMEHSRAYQKKKLSADASGFKRFVLIGEHLSHSLSVPIHNLFFKLAGKEGSYELREVPQNELPEILKKLRAEGYTGVNVTIPYKTAIMSSLDYVSDEVVRVGAVNTVLLGRMLKGYNTDYSGFGLALTHYGIRPKGKKCAVIGSGGSSRAVVSYLEDNWASDIVIVTRDADATSLKYPGLTCVELHEFSASGFDLVVNCTPVGMTPNAGVSPIDKKQLKGAGFVMDLIYNPAETLLLDYAKELEIPCANGLYMLAAQGICSQEIWQGTSFDAELVNKVYKEMKEL